MAENKIPIATDSEAELHELIGDDATATFESDPNFVDSNPTADASSDHIELRDTDDMEDSEEEDEEADEEDIGEEDEDDDGEDEEDEEEEEDDDDDDDDVDFDDEEDDDEAEVLRTAEPVDVHGPGKHSRIEIEEELEEMEEESGEDAIESPEDEEEEEGEERRHADRAIDEALRMGAVVRHGGIVGTALRV